MNLTANSKIYCKSITSHTGKQKSRENVVHMYIVKQTRQKCFVYMLYTVQMYTIEYTTQLFAKVGAVPWRMRACLLTKVQTVAWFSNRVSNHTG